MSNEFRPPAPAADLQSAVVVLSGGASGIGHATARALQKVGAHVLVGDISVPPGEKFTASSSAGINQECGSLHYQRCDVSKYDDVYALFHRAWNEFGKVDHAIASAGVLERGKLFDPELNVETVKQDDHEASSVIQVNLIGTINFARIAVVFLRSPSRGSNQEIHTSVSKSLTLVASVASIRESAGLFMYQTSKHGILGLLRSMRTPIFRRHGIRVNSVCPGMTDSAMTTSIIGAFRERGLATQSSEEVSRIIVGVLSSPDLSGKSMYVEGGKAWEFEDSVWETMPQWLGEEPTKLLKENAEFVASGALLKK